MEAINESIFSMNCMGMVDGLVVVDVVTDVMEMVVEVAVEAMGGGRSSEPATWVDS